MLVQGYCSCCCRELFAEALKSHALLYFAHGTADTQQMIAGFDVLRAELAAKQREAVFERIEGADHALDLPNQKVPEGLEEVLQPQACGTACQGGRGRAGTGRLPKACSSTQSSCWQHGLRRGSSLAAQ
jgi:hypothetical protein